MTQPNPTPAPPIKFWSVRAQSKSYMFMSVLAATPEEAIRIVNLPTHTIAKRAGSPGRRALLPSGEYLVLFDHTATAEDPTWQHRPGWAVTRMAGGRGGFQDEVVRFVTDQEAATLWETRQT